MPSTQETSDEVLVKNEFIKNILDALQVAREMLEELPLEEDGQTWGTEVITVDPTDRPSASTQNSDDATEGDARAPHSEVELQSHIKGGYRYVLKTAALQPVFAAFAYCIEDPSIESELVRTYEGAIWGEQKLNTRNTLLLFNVIFACATLSVWRTLLEGKIPQTTETDRLETIVHETIGEIREAEMIQYRENKKKTTQLEEFMNWQYFERKKIRRDMYCSGIFGPIHILVDWERVPDEHKPQWKLFRRFGVGSRDPNPAKTAAQIITKLETYGTAITETGYKTRIRRGKAASIIQEVIDTTIYDLMPPFDRSFPPTINPGEMDDKYWIRGLRLQEYAKANYIIHVC